ncbi:hypothetical protein BJ508DRAFT_182288 [Ascobolus immersus RN42]|uniref:Uncharacterized protein n=1 Tax=Ascobolus immersus RN42 TaxID=1160509 RepID=A0A3N4HVP7_ASCIM|nr:hypothetical protein BJ508DRAFT_182288 [Ascobolus immersus RN42]
MLFSGLTCLNSVGSLWQFLTHGRARTSIERNPKTYHDRSPLRTPLASNQSINHPSPTVNFPLATSTSNVTTRQPETVEFSTAPPPPPPPPPLTDLYSRGRTVHLSSKEPEQTIGRSRQPLLALPIGTMPFQTLTLYTIILTSYYPPPTFYASDSSPPFTPPPTTTHLSSFTSKFKANREFQAIFAEDYWEEAGKPSHIHKEPDSGLFRIEWRLYNPAVPVAPGDNSRNKAGGAYKREMRIEESVVKWNDDECEEDASEVIDLDKDGLPRLQADEVLVTEGLEQARREDAVMGNGSGRKRALTDLLEREDGGKAMRFGEYARSFVKA